MKAGYQHRTGSRLSRRQWLLLASAVPSLRRAALGQRGALGDDVEASVKYLAAVQDRFHTAFDVYTDVDAAGNHFVARARMSSPGDEVAIPEMLENWTQNSHSGSTCIRAEFHSKGDNWGGWYFMNGVLTGDTKSPAPNWGTVPSAGVDLRGALQLTFWARGERSGETVEFFFGGVGRDAETGRVIELFPDSSPKLSTGWVPLSREWKRFTISLDRADLSYVLGGFGWATSQSKNAGRDIVFYLDDIRFELSDQRRAYQLRQPRFLLSYETSNSLGAFENVMRNAAFTYDNAVALHAFLAVNDVPRARLIADALVAASRYDRGFQEGTLRNAYAAGDLFLPPGWEPRYRARAVRLPGWFDVSTRQWFEDEFQISTHTGNVAWSVLALTALFERTGEREYLETSVLLAESVERLKDVRGAGGYRGGFQGEDESRAELMYKSTEHNLDLIAAFRRLVRLTGDSKWRDRAEGATRFVRSMWNVEKRIFHTGTGLDGVTTNESVIPLDGQSWSVLTLAPEGESYDDALTSAEKLMGVGGGYDFNEDKDGIWFEGTSQMLLAYKMLGSRLPQSIERIEFLTRLLTDAAKPSGALPASNKDGLTTGFYWSEGEPWLYFNRPHVGATAWWVVAASGFNPFADSFLSRRLLAP